jgi:hypothetical protein
MTAAREKYYYLLLSPSIKKNLVHDPLLYLLYTGSEEGRQSVYIVEKATQQLLNSRPKYANIQQQTISIFFFLLALLIFAYFFLFKKSHYSSFYNILNLTTNILIDK